MYKLPSLSEKETNQHKLETYGSRIHTFPFLICCSVFPLCVCGSGSCLLTARCRTPALFYYLLFSATCPLTGCVVPFFSFGCLNVGFAARIVCCVQHVTHTIILDMHASYRINTQRGSSAGYKDSWRCEGFQDGSEHDLFLTTYITLHLLFFFFSTVVHISGRRPGGHDEGLKRT